MDTNQYKNLFISETREILNSLNKVLVQLEKSPNDKESINEIFRQTHTLKGMSATMGYEDITKLTHNMESVLDLFRKQKLEIDVDIVNLFFSSFDLLEELVDSIAYEKTSEKDKNIQANKVSDLSEKLNRIKDNYEKEILEESPKERRTNLRLEAEDRIEIVKNSKKGNITYQVTVTLKKECTLVQARAFVVVKKVEKYGKIVRSEYIYKQLEKGKFGRYFGFFLITSEQAVAIKRDVEGIQDVEKITFKPLEIDECFIDSQTTKILNADSEKDNEEKQKEKNKKELQTVRVALDRLDRLVNITGELVINKIRLMNIGNTSDNKSLTEALTQLEHLTNDLQNEMMLVRLIPIDYIFNRFPRVIRDLANDQKKQVDLNVSGGDIGLDRAILDEINEPLVHLLTNALTHGIELPQERKKQGKSERGIIKLTARREKNFVVVEVSDDGKGIDPEAIEKAAIEKKLITKEKADTLSDEEKLFLITLPGLSTSQTVTKTAGRGVGMDYVRVKAESFGGSLSIDTTLNKGTTFSLKLPLTMAIIQALLVRVASERFAIPLINISETIKIKEEIIKIMNAHEVIPYRDEVLPLVRMDEQLGFLKINSEEKPAIKSGLPVAIVESNQKRAGLIVDKLLGQQEVVIKTLSGKLKNTRGLAGATILGDGKVAMIIDVGSLL